jgi:phospholipase A1
LLLLLGLTVRPAAAVAPPDLGPCVDIAVDADRLACYDKQVGRAAMVALPVSPAAPVAASAPAPTQVPTQAPPPSDSFLSRYWELDPADKRGTFNYTAYRPNFVMPLHLMRHVNQTPSSPSQGKVTSLPDYQNGEAKLQISLRTKIAQDLLLPGGDLWVGYTQQSLWQVWNHSESAPFRNTDYQPEVMYLLPTPDFLRDPVLGWSWRLSQIGLLHQSNGQPGELSRSWNRVYALFGVENGDVSATWRFEYRTGKTGQNDDNPDIVHFLGKSQFQIGWTPGLSTASMTWRPSLDGRGSLQIDWTYPFDRHKPDGLRGYVQLFQGYGETILDYNFRQTSLGLGLSIFKF